MILNNLQLVNFKKYTQKSFTFEEGLIGIIGKNGSGKSSIFEAILFALYGETKNKKELLKNSSVDEKEPVSVTLEFEFDNATYKVIREFKGKSLTANAKLYKNDDLIASGAKEATTAIAKLTKMSKDAFLHTLFASQKELTSLSNLKPEDRKKMIRKLLGLEKIDAIESMLIEKSRELKREIDAYRDILLSNEEVEARETQIKALDENKQKISLDISAKTKDIEALEQAIKDLKANLESLQKTKDVKTKLLNEAEVLNTQIKALNEQLLKQTNELKELEQKQEELTKLEPIKTEFENLQTKLKEQQNQKELWLKKDGLEKEQVQLREQYTKAKDDIAQLEQDTKDYAQLNAKYQELQNGAKELLAKLKDNEAQIKNIDSLISGEQKLIDNTNLQIDKISKLGKDSNCPTCTRPLLDAYDSVLSSLSSTINTIQKEKIDTYKTQLLSFEVSKTELDKQKDTLDKGTQATSQQLAIIETKQKDLTKAKEHFNMVEAKGLENKKAIEALANLSYDEKAHLELAQKEQTLKPQYDTYAKLCTELQRVAVVQKQLQELGVNIDTKQKELMVKDEQAKAVVYDEAIHITKQAEFETTNKQKEDIATLANSFKVQIASIDGEIKTIQSALNTNKEHQSKQQAKLQDVSDYEKIKKSLSEFKTKLNSKVAPRISSIASNMYAQITKGKYQHIEVDNDFNFFIYDDGKKYTIERFSGGEIDLANLVLRIAISKTLGELSGAGNIGFLAFDEVFGSQDESRRMQILEAFHTIKEQYRQIFLISHESEIKEMFERVVEV